MRVKGTPYERILAHIERVTETGCWVWLGHVQKNGYASMGVRGRTRWVHRIAFENAHGPLPKGAEVDHRCRVRSCVNPDHLRAVTRRENLLLGETFASRNRSREACPKGHPYDDANTYLSQRGQRSCRTCGREAARLRRRMERAA